MPSTLFLVGTTVLLLAAILIHNASNRSKVPPDARLPPGPKGKPIVGNLLDIPPKHSWLKFKEWADQYGPIYRLDVFGRNLVIVSTEKVANDLLRERGNIYSSREQLPMAAQLISDGLRPLFLPHGELWRRGRKVMHNMTMHASATSYQPVQIYESERLLRDLMTTPAKYESIFERYAAAVVLRLVYGKAVDTGDEQYVRDILKIVHTVERAASPGVYLVDTFPILMWLPAWLAPFKREAARLHAFELQTFRGLLFEVRDKMRAGTAPKCFSRSFLEKQAEYHLSDDEGAYVLGTLFEAGAGTTAAAMMSFALCMCLHPEWQQKMHDEVDRVVGDGRMPDYSDMPSLPTCRAVIKEVLRWRPVTAGGVPHELVKDDVYNGFFFPAGTNIHPNQWAIHRDPELYPDPETFNPGRWLSPKYPTYREPLDKFPNLQNYSCFGFGRRICPGMNIAENSLHLLTARIAWAAHISKRPGVEVPPYDYTVGFNVQPRPFVFDLKARSEARKTLIDTTWESGKTRNPLDEVKTL
ncbi:25-hydroxyvitamin D-1 alpha hydroxylase [Cladophialophora carrionii]|uniref:25-hydroxyvitamin D-1 alpha hydroxylase n=1 Tax=Cladophialophora carrionii TaxID=86049 RepID=A0A1C1CCA4_9EURO|nr:25-hydroxyvitamin D-1 alpha hydroxylase [Cladophialophora carrionii]